MGYAMAAILGAPTERVNSGIMESEMVEMPAASISLCTSPTDRQQNGQTGTSTAASTSSAFICSIMAGHALFQELTRLEDEALEGVVRRGRATDLARLF
jgi:hypothetical protein